MLTATIHLLTNGEDQVLGKIIARDGALSCEPQKRSLSAICETPIYDENGEKVMPDDAENFVRNLSLNYCGTYLSADEAVDE